MGAFKLSSQLYRVAHPSFRQVTMKVTSTCPVDTLESHRECISGMEGHVGLQKRQKKSIVSESKVWKDIDLAERIHRLKFACKFDKLHSDLIDHMIVVERLREFMFLLQSYSVLSDVKLSC